MIANVLCPAPCKDLVLRGSLSENVTAFLVLLGVPDKATGFASSLQVGIADLDICGPSVPKLMAVEGKGVVNSQYGWMPLKCVE